MPTRLAQRSLWRATWLLPAASPRTLQTQSMDRRFATAQRKQKTAVVTGAGRGIGRSIAVRLARDGYDVCVNDIHSNVSEAEDTVSAINSLGRNAFAYYADVANAMQVADMVAASVAKLGPLDTMVANAGVAQVKALLDLTEQDLRRMFEVNVYGVYNCYASAARQMIEQGTRGKLIGAASIVAFKPFALLSHYSASKFAVRGLTQAFAMEMAPHGITVNAYAPGIVDTPMWELIDAELGKLKGAEKGETIKRFTHDLIALGRTSVPDDVSKVVSFLAGPDSEYVTGQTVVVDGGVVFT